MKYTLTSKQVEDLKIQGKTNEYKFRANKSIKDIILSNIFTLFNFINVVLAIFVIFTGSFKNLLFMIIIAINTLIGLYQEIKAKKILDNLSLLVAEKVKVIRDDKIEEILPDEVVLGEYIKVSSGDQIVCDAKVVEGTIECDESLLTGESDMIGKVEGDNLYSGSFITSGTATICATAVGKDSYINKLSSKAKVFRRYPSKLRDSLNYILKIASFMIVPIGIGLFIKMYYFQHIELNTTILKIVAALIGMIAEGLILLTSVTLAVSSVNLARKKVLVQELFCIETLARVDTLCFDKTGTLTTGNMKVVSINSINGEDYNDLIGAYVRSFDDVNATSLAIRDFTKEKRKLSIENSLPFSSSRKYSAIKIKDDDTYILGAYEYIFKGDKDIEQIKDAINDGKRVLVFARTDEDIIQGKITKEPELLAIIILEDEIRNNINEVFEYFRKQGVDIKIISGDNHISVLEIAKRAGLEENSKAIDVSKLTDEELKKAVFMYQVFGRVNPNQKKLMVEALKEKGKKVAMSGDGVNDVLALKEADISIAMSNGSPATKQIANIVLLNSEFSNFYAILMEGRRVINNIQKVASLFLVKTFYSAAISLISIFTFIPYPFIPIQLTMISTLTVGVPSFFITFEKSKERIKDNFMRDVFVRSSSAALRLIVGIAIITLIGYRGNVATNMIFIMTLLNGLYMLREVLRPFNTFKTLLFSGIVGLSIIPFIFFRSFFALTKIAIMEYIIAVLVISIIYFVFKAIYKKLNIYDT